MTHAQVCSRQPALPAATPADDGGLDGVALPKTSARRRPLARFLASAAALVVSSTAGFFAASPDAAAATTYYWVGAVANQYWEDYANWSLNADGSNAGVGIYTLPQAGDDVYMASNASDNFIRLNNLANGTVIAANLHDVGLRFNATTYKTVTLSGNNTFGRYYGNAGLSGITTGSLLVEGVQFATLEFTSAAALGSVDGADSNAYLLTHPGNYIYSGDTDVTVAGLYAQSHNDNWQTIYDRDRLEVTKAGVTLTIKTFCNYSDGKPYRRINKMGAGTVKLSNTVNPPNEGHFSVWEGKLILAATLKDDGSVHALRDANECTLLISGGTVEIGGDIKQPHANGNQIASNSVVWLKTGTLDLNGRNERFLRLDFDGGTLTNSDDVNRSLLITGDGNARTFAGAITGNLSLQKEGTGTWTLSGALQYSGETIFNSASTINFSTAIGVSSIGTLKFLNTSAVLDLTGPAPLQIAGFSAGSNGGTIALGTNAALGEFTIGKNGVAAGTEGDGSGTFSGVISGSRPIIKTGGGAAILSGANTFTGTLTVNEGSLTLSGANSSTNTITVNDGELVLTNNGNKFTGTINVTGGVLSVPLLDGSTNSATSSTLGVTTGNGSGSRSINLYEGGTFRYTGTANKASDPNTLSKLLFQIGGDGTGIVEITDAEAVIDVERVTKDLIKTGAGTLYLGGAATGGVIAGVKITVAEGSLMCSHAFEGDAIELQGGTSIYLHGDNKIKDAAYIALTGTGATFDMRGSEETIGALSGVAGSIVTNTGNSKSNIHIGGIATWVQGADADKSLKVYGGTENNDFAGTIQDGTKKIGLTKTGSTGVQILSGTNTYTMATTIEANGGELHLGNGGSSGSIDNTASISIGANAKLVFNRSDDGLVISKAISGAGSVAQIGSGITKLSATNSYTGGTTITNGAIEFSAAENFGSGNITINGGGLRWAAGHTDGITRKLNAIGENGASFDTNGNDVAFGYAITGSGGIEKKGDGELEFRAANSYTGATSVSGGTLALDVAGAVASSSGVNLAAGATLSVSASNLLNGLESATGSTVDIGASATLTLGNAAAATIDVISGSGSLSKTGTGELTITGAGNNHTGTISVNTGTLRLTGNNAVANSSKVELGGSAKLAVDEDNEVSNLVTTSANEVAIATGKTLTLKNTTDLTIAGAITSGGTLTQNGSGKTTLSNAANTHTATVISAGTISITSVGALGSGSLTLDGGTLENSGAGAINLAGLASVTASSDSTIAVGAGASIDFGVISGTGTITVTGDGVVKAESFSDGTLGAGNWSIKAGGAIGGVTEHTVLTTHGGDGGVAISSLAAPQDVTFTVNNQTGAQYQASTGVTFGTGNQIYLPEWMTGTFTVLSAADTISGEDNLAVSVAGVEPEAHQKTSLSLANEGKALMLALEILSVDLTWKGDSANNVWDGGATNWLLGDGSTEAAFVDGDLLKFDNAGVHTVPVNVANAVTASQITIEGGNYNFSGAKITVRANAAQGGATATGELTITGSGTTASFGNAVDLEKVVVSDGANAVFNGDFTVTANGVISINGGSSLTLPASGAVSIGVGTTLELAHTGATTSTLVLPAGVNATIPSGTVKIGNTSAHATVDVGAGSTLTIGGAIQSENTVDTNIVLEKSGAGALVLSGTNTYLGKTIVSGGVLEITSSQSLGDSNTQLLLGNASETVRLRVSGSGGGVLLAHSIEISGKGAEFETLGNRTTTLTNGMNVAADSVFEKLGTGTLTFASSNTFDPTSVIKVSEGTLAIEGSTNALNGATQITLGATLAASVSLGTTAAITIPAAGTGTVSVGTGATVTLSGVISGGKLAKSGSGILDLGGGTNNFATLDVKEGTLRFDAVTAIGDGDIVLGGTEGTATSGTLALNNTGAHDLSARDITLNGGGTVDVGAGGELSSSGALFGTGTLTKSGDGTLILNGSGSSYSGAVNLTGGILALGDPTAAGSGAVAVANNTELRIDGNGTHGNALSGAGTVTVVGDVRFGTGNASFNGKLAVESGGKLEVLSGASIGTARLEIAGTFAIAPISEGGTIALTFLPARSVALGASGGTLHVPDAAQTLTIDTPLSGGVLTKTGGGSVVLTKSNTYSGGTQVKGGTVSFSSNNALGAASSPIELDGGTLLATSTVNLVGRVITVGNEGGGIKETLPAGILSIPGDIVGTGALATLGSGTVKFTSAKTFTGDLTVREGTLLLDAADALVNAASVTISADSRLETTKAQAFTVLTIEENGSLALSGTIPSDRNLNLVEATISGSITGTAAVPIGANEIKIADGGKLTVGSGNTIHSGANIVFGAGSTLYISGENALSASTNISFGIDSSTGSVDAPTNITVTEYMTGIESYIVATAPTINTNYVATVNSEPIPTGITIDTYMNIDIKVEGAANVSQTLKISSGLTWNNTDPGTQHGTFYIAQDERFTIGAIDEPYIIASLADNGNASGGTGFDGWDGKTLRKRGKGELVLASTNTYTGDTIIEEGTLTLRKTDAAGAGSGVVRFEGSDTSVTRILNFDIANSASGTFSKVIAGSNGTVNKNGTGTLTLSGVSTYTGRTNIASGTLAIGGDGSIAASLLVRVDPGATFSIANTTDGTRIKNIIASEGSYVALGGKTLTIGETDASGHVEGTGGSEIRGVLTGTGTLVKSGLSTLTLAGANQHTGGVIFRGGTLVLAHNNALGSTVANGKLTHISQGVLTIAHDLVIANEIEFDNDSTRKVNVDADGRTVLSGKWIGDDAVVQKSGAGTLALTNPAALTNYTGEINISAGTLEIHAPRFENKLSGAGVLKAVLDSKSTRFTFAGTDDGFTGKFEFERGLLAVNTASTVALGKATLALGANATLEVGAVGAGSLGGVETHGATITFALNGLAPAALLEAKTLDLTDGVAVRIDLDASLDLDGANADLYSLWDGSATNRWQLATALETLAPPADESSVTYGNLAGKTLDETLWRVLHDGAAGRVGEAAFVHTGELRTDSAVISENGFWFSTILTQIVADEGRIVELRLAQNADSSIAKLNANLTGSGGFAFIGTGGESAEISGAGNDYTGATLVDGVALLVSSANGLGNTSRLTLANGATVDLGGFRQTVRSLWASDVSTEISLGNGGTLEVAGNGDFAGTLTGSGGANETLNPALAKSGTGTLVLRGENTYTGGTSINGGTLRIEGTIGAIGATGAVYSSGIALDGGNLDLVQSAAQTFSGVISGNGGLSKHGSGRLLLTGTQNSYGETIVTAGTLALTNNGSNGIGVNTINGATLELAGPLGTIYSKAWTIGTNGMTIAVARNSTLNGALTGNGGLVKTGVGTLTLGAENTYAGGISVLEGALSIASDANLGRGENRLNGGALNLTGTQYGSNWIIEANNGTLSTVTPGGTSVFNGNITGAGTLSKVGAGTLEFNGRVVTPLILTNGTIGGNGTITNATFAAGTAISPGEAGTIGTINLGSPGTLTKFNDVTFNIDVGAGGGADLVWVAGNAQFATTAANIIDVTTVGAAAGVWADGSYTIFTAAGALETGDFFDDTLFRYRGIDISTISGGRVRAALEIAPDGRSLVLRTYASAGNKMEWDGGIGTNVWENAALDSGNWKEDETAGAIFLNGDLVTFTDGGSARRIEVSTNGGGVIVGHMEIKGEGYVFEGGKIVGTALFTSGSVTTEADGALIVADGASATFYNAVEFTKITVSGTAEFSARTRSGAVIDVSAGGRLVLAGATGILEADVRNEGVFAIEKSTGRNYSHTGVISGSGSFEKTGGGRVALTRINTYTGETRVLGGTLAIDTDANIGDGLNTLDGGTLEISGGSYAKAWTLGTNGGAIQSDAVATFGGTISGTGSFEKKGTGTLTLTGAVEYAGETIVSGGTLEITGEFGTPDASGRHISTGEISIADGAKLALTQGRALELATTLDGAGGFVKNGAGTLTISGSSRRHNIGSFENTGGTTAIAGDLETEKIANSATFDVKQVTLRSGGLDNSGNFTANTIETLLKGVTNTGTLNTNYLFLRGSNAAAILQNSGTLTVTENIEANAGLQNNGTLTANKVSIPQGASLVNHNAFSARNVEAAGGVVNTGTLGVAVLLQANNGLLNSGNGVVEVGHLIVQGGVNNSGVIRAAAASLDTGGLVNAPQGVVEISDVFDGDAENRGVFTARAVTGDFDNATAGAVATIGYVNGNLVNRGSTRIKDFVYGDVVNHYGSTLTLNAENNEHMIGGTLKNSGTVWFDNFGQNLYVRNLANATLGTPGTYNVEVDFADPSRSDHIELDAAGIVEGEHVFIVRNVEGGATATRETTIDLIQGGVINDTARVSVAAPVQAGLYSFEVVGGGNATLRATGYSGSGQGAVNSAGVLATGWFNQLDNLHKRLGELRLGPANGNDKNAFWFRAYAAQINADLGLTGVSKLRQHQYGGDVGLDRTFGLGDSGTLWVGAFAGYQISRLSFHDRQASSGDTESATLGSYFTWEHRDGWFVDSVLKGQYFSSEFKSGNERGEFENHAVGFSLEFGKRFELGDGWFVEPSAQVSYSHLFANSYSLEESRLRVKPSDSDILRYLESVRVGKVITLADGARLQPALRVGVERQDSDGGSVRISNEKFNPSTDGMRGVVGASITWEISENRQLHFDYETSFGDKYDKPWSFNASYRLRF
ncbi:MAG: autotransporter-associated beta strand repeat-containing protein [Puniceicoccales bacterium]|nr:autotransporter-associated beta strand repeat-containing protein [Puniceicoccales bacterium]